MPQGFKNVAIGGKECSLRDLRSAQGMLEYCQSVALGIPHGT